MRICSFGIQHNMICSGICHLHRLRVGNATNHSLGSIIFRILIIKFSCESITWSSVTQSHYHDPFLWPAVITYCIRLGIYIGWASNVSSDNPTVCVHMPDKTCQSAIKNIYPWSMCSWRMHYNTIYTLFNTFTLFYHFCGCCRNRSDRIWQRGTSARRPLSTN